MNHAPSPPHPSALHSPHPIVPFNPVNVHLHMRHIPGLTDGTDCRWARALKGAISPGLGGASRASAPAGDGDAGKSSRASMHAPSREAYSRQPSVPMNGFDKVQRGDRHSPSRRSSASSIPDLESLQRAGQGYTPTKKYSQTSSPEAAPTLSNHAQSGSPCRADGIGAGAKVRDYQLVGGGSAPRNVSTDLSGGIGVSRGSSDTDSSGASSSEGDEDYSPSKGTDTSSVLKHYTSLTPRGGARRETKPPQGVPTLALGGLLGGGVGQGAIGVEGGSQSAYKMSNHSDFGGHGASGSPTRFGPGGLAAAPSNTIKPLAIAPITSSSGSAFKAFVSPRASKMGSLQSPKVPAAPPPITPRSTRPVVTPRGSIPRSDTGAWSASPRTDNVTARPQQQQQQQYQDHHHHYQQQQQPSSRVEGDAAESRKAYAAWDERWNVPYSSSGSQTARLSTSLSSWGAPSPRVVGDMGQWGMSGSMSARGGPRSGNDGSLSARGAPPVPVLTSELFRDEEPEEAQEIYTQNGTTYFRAATR